MDGKIDDPEMRDLVMALAVEMQKRGYVAIVMVAQADDPKKAMFNATGDSLKILRLIQEVGTDFLDRLTARPETLQEDRPE